MKKRIFAVGFVLGILSLHAEIIDEKMIARSPYEDGFCSIKWELVKGSAADFDKRERQDNQYRIPGVAMSDKGLVVTVYDCRYMSDRDLGWNHSANGCTLRGWDKKGKSVNSTPNGWEPIDIAGNESPDRGKKWTKPKVVIDVPNSSEYEKDGAPTKAWSAAKSKADFDFGDPCILFDPGDKKSHPAKFWCMGITGGGLRSAGAGNDCVLYSRLAEPGAKWGNRRSIKAEVLDLIGQKGGTVFQGPGQGLYLKHSKTLPKGTIVFPMQYFGGFVKAFAIYSTDHGETWKATDFCPEGGSQENQITEMPDGSWLMMVKSAGGGPRRFYRSTDYKTWTSYSDNAPSSNAVQGSCIYIGANKKLKKHVYATCYSRENRMERRKLTLAFGVDTGEKIEWNWDIENFPEIMIHEGSTMGKSYNSLVMLDENTLGILYESCYHIYFVRVDIRKHLGK